MENSSKKKFIINIVIASLVMVVLLLIDIISKVGVHNYFVNNNIKEILVIENFFWIRLTYNTGALFSFLAGSDFGRVILCLLSIAGSIASIWYLVKNFTKLKLWPRIALYLFIPGCIGNLIDRIGIYKATLINNPDGVIDFLSFRLFGVWDFAIFNFADMCLTVSVALFIIISFLAKDENPTKNDVEEILNS